jgi:hypothetical protein
MKKHLIHSDDIRCRISQNAKVLFKNNMVYRLRRLQLTYNATSILEGIIKLIKMLVLINIHNT